MRVKVSIRGAAKMTLSPVWFVFACDSGSTK